MANTKTGDPAVDTFLKGYPPPVREIAGLRALARARRSEERDSHTQLPYTLERDFDFFRKPS